MTKLILKTDIFKSSNIFFDIYIYIKKFQKIYQLNIINKIKKDFKKKLVKDIKIVMKKKKKKNNYMVANVTKISQKMKSKSLLRIEKIL